MFFIFGVGQTIDAYCDPHWLAVSAFSGYCQLVSSKYAETFEARRVGSKTSDPVRFLFSVFFT